MLKFRYIKFASNFHLFISYFKKSSSTWELERDVCRNGPVSFDPFPDTLYWRWIPEVFPGVRWNLSVSVEGRHDTAFLAAQRFTIKMEFSLVSRRLSLSQIWSSHGPLRVITSCSRFALVSSPNHAENEAPEEEARLGLCSQYRRASRALKWKAKSYEWTHFKIFIHSYADDSIERY